MRYFTYSFSHCKVFSLLGKINDTDFGEFLISFTVCSTESLAKKSLGSTSASFFKL